MLKPYYKQTQSINIEPPRSYYVPFGESDKESYDREDSGRFMSLNGTWKITAYDRVLDVPDDFYNTDGEKDILVPSCVQYFGYDFFSTQIHAFRFRSIRRIYRAKTRRINTRGISSISSPFDSNYFCEMLVSKDKSGGYIVGERVPTYPHGWVTNQRKE